MIYIFFHKIYICYIFCHHCLYNLQVHCDVLIVDVYQKPVYIQ